MDFLARVEATAFSTWVRESGSLWAYPGILFLHTIGLAFLVGMNVAVDLRILGFARGLPIAPLERAFPVMWAGFCVNAASGTMLLIADATTKLTNPVFYVKMGFITLAVVNMVILRRYVFRGQSLGATPLSWVVRTLAVTSLICWLGAISAGRLMAYFGPVSGQPHLFNEIGN